MSFLIPSRGQGEQVDMRLDLPHLVKKMREAQGQTRRGTPLVTPVANPHSHSTGIHLSRKWAE